MCGRYTTGTEVENIHFREIMDEANRTMQGENEVILRENGDVYPGDVAPVMLTISSKSMFTGMRWGFDFDGKKVINARSETAHEKPAFRQSLAAMRCLVPVMGYYEWNARKEKFLFTDPNGDIFYLAGLYRFGEMDLRSFPYSPGMHTANTARYTTECRLSFAKRSCGSGTHPSPAGCWQEAAI